jgi:dephospho-CoA kinase
VSSFGNNSHFALVLHLATLGKIPVIKRDDAVKSLCLPHGELHQAIEDDFTKAGLK